jgi:hypothetical protein
MNTLLENNLTIYWATVGYSRSARGKYEATLHLSFGGEVVKFTHKFNDAEIYDELSAISYSEGKAEKIYETFQYIFDDLIDNYLFETNDIC